MSTVDRLYELYREHPEVSTDSRAVPLGSLFFALHGESFDGNEYAIRALQSGASHAVVDREDIAEQNPDYSDRIVLVEDTLTTLQQLARHHRRALSGVRLLAITGSNGKTTTKELLRSVLSTKYSVYATRGNLNNHIGVPLTLLSIPEGCEVAVVEMGASHRSEIALLCSIAEPDYGLITNIGRAHLEGFGGEDGVRLGKGELFDYLAQEGGVAYVPIEDQTISEMAEIRDGLQRIEYSYSLAEGIRSNLEGVYNRYNIATAVAVGEDMGVSREQAAEAIAEYYPNNNRSQRVESERNTLIVDCYNANPSSMESSIENFKSENYPNREAKVLILGDMFELGEWSGEEHERVVRRACDSDVESILLVGEEFSRVACEESRVEQFASREALEQRLQRERIEGRAVLIKGSRGVGLESIIKLL